MLRLEAAPDRQSAGHPLRDGSIESGIAQRAQEFEELGLTPSAHIQLARQRVDLIPAHLGVCPSPSKTASASPADPPIEADHVWKRRKHAAVHVWSRRAEGA